MIYFPESHVQAAHWFDLKQFYSEVHRTLKPMGVLAVYGYALPEVANKQYLHLNDVIQQVISLHEEYRKGNAPCFFLNSFIKR